MMRDIFNKIEKAWGMPLEYSITEDGIRTYVRVSAAEAEQNEDLGELIKRLYKAECIDYQYCHTVGNNITIVFKNE